MNETTDSFSVAGQNVLVVGATRGIGRAIALRFARAGARVIANYVRSEESALSLAGLGASEQLRIETLRADVSMDKGLEQLVSEVTQRMTPLHTIIFAAATGVHRDLDQLSARHFDFVFGLNVRAFVLLVRGLLPVMTAGGTILSLSSEGAERVMPKYGLVSASKAALEAMTRQWALELAPRGIRANVVSPGSVNTDAWKVLPGGEERLAAAAAKTPRGSLVTLEEISQTAQFLASRAGAGISGQTIIVDAGARILGSG
jgi:enoyl-[acyl-carrier protein] reductase III